MIFAVYSKEMRAVRGYAPLYRAGTCCPGCGRSNWTIGRSSAECAFCATALPLAPAEQASASEIAAPGWAARA